MVTTINSKRAADGRPPAAKRVKPDYSSESIITVLVGPAEKSYTVHKSAVCAKSSFFEKACTERWPEGKEGVVRLPEAEVDVFDVFLHFAYSDRIDSQLLDVSETTEPKICSLWGLASFLQSYKLCNKLIDHVLLGVDLLSGTNQCCDMWTAKYLEDIWAATSDTCNLRRLFIDLVIAYVRPAAFEKDADHWPRDVLLAAAKRLVHEKNTKSKLTQKSSTPGSVLEPRAKPADLRSIIASAQKAGFPKVVEHAQPVPVKPTFADRCRYHEHKFGERKCGETSAVNPEWWSRMMRTTLS